MASVIKAGNATDGVHVTSDNTGILELKTGTGSGTTAMTVGTDQAVTFAQAANLPNTFGFKNRIINGAMVIDQRNAGASVTPANGTFSVDRWAAEISQASKFSFQQNAGSVTPPAGFTNYLGVTSLSAYTVGSGEVFNLYQRIEGLNIGDLAWGTANASTVTLSFWVRSSLTGTFGGALQNNGNDRSYPFSFTISAANTWEQKSVTIPGDTTGTWLTTNGIGIRVRFSLGTGSTVSGTAGAWAGSDFRSATGATSVVGTNGATFYITGVQLEKGSTATSFDYRPYSTELQLAQRYYVSLINNINQELGGAWNYSATQVSGMLYAPVPMRSTPAIISSSGTNYYIFYRNGTNDQFNSITIEFANASNTAVSYFNNTEISGTAGQAGLVRSFNALTSVALSSEL